MSNIDIRLIDFGASKLCSDEKDRIEWSTPESVFTVPCVNSRKDDIHATGITIATGLTPCADVDEVEHAVAEGKATDLNLVQPQRLHDLIYHSSRRDGREKHVLHRRI